MLSSASPVLGLTAPDLKPLGRSCLPISSRFRQRNGETNHLDRRSVVPEEIEMIRQETNDGQHQQERQNAHDQTRARVPSLEKAGPEQIGSRIESLRMSITEVVR